MLMKIKYYNHMWADEKCEIEDWVIGDDNWWINRIMIDGNIKSVWSSRDPRNFKDIYFLRGEIYNESKPEYSSKVEEENT